MQAQMAIGVASTFGILLVSLVIFIWKKNQKLEYKYMKLVQSSGGKCELPEAETCALGEGEEEENAACIDRVRFVSDKSAKRTNWLSNGDRATTADGFENQLLRKGSDDNDEA
ncbi:unnamed protein product [Soboliphyme baturini]|uniref:NRXN1 n=1 Tax=Soboliphyme baturini TaxID=241478 RepID=A0A183IVM0_9BILA|nr:unnamed protein product [Soboliphyme baturini]